MEPSVARKLVIVFEESTEARTRHFSEAAGFEGVWDTGEKGADCFWWWCCCWCPWK